MKFSVTVLAAIVSIAAFSVCAQVEVVDRQLPTDSSRSATQDSPVNTGEMYYQIQVLQQEVLQLRGMLEEQAFQIKKLKQQRLDDYLDLDRRLGQAGGAAVARSQEAQATQTSQDAQIAQGAASPAEELKSYKAAINLLLKEQKYDEAIFALKKHLEDYPQGRYSANAQYWLGETYLLKNELERSRQWFSRLLKEHPQHSKVPDTQFKLGKVYNLLGDKATARTLLEQSANSNSNAARLAREYLNAHFSP